MNGLNKKKCSKCLLLLELRFFSRSYRTKDGYSNLCKSCEPTQVKQPQENKKRIILTSSKFQHFRKDIWWNYYKDGCIICEEKEICCLDFHHLIPSTKKYIISKIWNAVDINILVEEINKCVVVCKNCHAKIHNNKIDINNYKPIQISTSLFG